MNLQAYGISDALVHRIKQKMKNPLIKDRMKRLLEGVNKYDLQDRIKVRNLVAQSCKILNERLTPQQTENIVQFVLAQKIDPQNTFHLIRLWNMFR